MPVFRKESRIPCSAEHLFSWHEQPAAFSKLLPPGEPVKILHHDGRITDGARAVLQAGFWPLRFKWVLEHRDYVQGRQFCDVQITGPFRSYRHVHRMIPASEHESVLSDEITFEMPLGRIGNFLAGPMMMKKFERLFEYRHRVTTAALSS